MITKMKKLTFLVYHTEYEEFLNQLRDSGVVHVVTRQQGTSTDSVLQDNVRLLSRMQSLSSELTPRVSAVGAGPESGTPEHFTSAGQVVEAYDALQADKARIEQRLQVLEKNLQELVPWGDFRPESVQRLSEAGYEIRFYSCPPKAYDEEWESEYNATVISSDKQKVYFITVTEKDVVPEIDADVNRLPNVSLSDVTAEKEKLEAESERYEEHLTEIAVNGVALLDDAVKDMSANIDLERVRLSGEHTVADRLILLEGWVPEERKDSVSDLLKTKGVFYEISDPTPDDDIPIQLKNSRFARLFEPLTRLYMLPTYQELDLTLFFAPFFMLFFGLCLGDTGYGLLMLIAMPVFEKLFKLINPDFSKGLVILFGISTMFCGLLSGTFFGFNIYDLDIGFVQKMKEFLYIDNSRMFTVSLCIGVVQILFGMILKAINLSIQCGVKYAVSTIGWISLLLTIILAVITGTPLGSTIVLVFLGIAAVAIFLFNSPGKNPLLNIGLGLWDSYNMATGLLGDVLSYVRLFALGLSGSILANVFNSMAVGMSPDIPVVGLLVTVLIFVIGHGLNIFMNFLGAIVHPMRLTFVEFFKNSGYTGGGTEYKPFSN